MIGHSTARVKPKKPRIDFPLFPHARGYWAKKVRGKLLYFGKVADDPKGEAALQKWADDELRSLNAQIEFVLRRLLREEGRLKEDESKEPSGPE